MIGKELSTILEEIENAIWEFDANSATKPEYTMEGFRAATKIFMSALMDKIWELQEADNIDIKDRMAMVQKAGEDVRNLIKTYTNIDTHEMYKK